MATLVLPLRIRPWMMEEIGWMLGNRGNVHYFCALLLVGFVGGV